MKRSTSHITTERLWLRQIDETDTESIVGLRSDERVFRYFLKPSKLTVDEHLHWYREKYIHDRNRIDWIAVDDDTGAFVGIYGAKKIASGEAEISYITADCMKRRGYAFEAVEAVINWCVKQWKIRTAVVEIHKENSVSIAFADMMGFKNVDSNESFVKMRKYLAAHDR